MIINFSENPSHIELFKNKLISKGMKEIKDFTDFDELWNKIEGFIKAKEPNNFAIFNEIIIVTDNFDMTKEALYRTILSYMHYTNKN
jgi:hypothetical protein